MFFDILTIYHIYYYHQIFLNKLYYRIRSSNNFLEAPKRMFELIQTFQCKEFEHEKKELYTTLTNNSFSLFPDNFLAAMAFDNARDLRETAVAKLLVARAEKCAPLKLRDGAKLKLQINFNAKHWSQLVEIEPKEWQKLLK